MSFFKNTRNLVASGILGAIGSVLMLINFNIPSIMPVFIKFDVSELPAILASFAYGPLGGIMVCLVKNVLNLVLGSDTAGVGELSNFILGCAYVIPAGLIYQKHRTFKGAIVGALTGCFTSAILCWFTNNFIVYPLYGLLGWTEELILSMYQAIFPFVNTLEEAIFVFNVPFTFIKLFVTAIITFLIYKRLSPLLRGKKQNKKEA